MTILESKRVRLAALLESLGGSLHDIFPSADEGYRMRAEFRIWHQGDALDYAMFAQGDSLSPQAVAVFKPGHPKLQQLMTQLRAALIPEPALRHKLFQAEFLTTLHGDALVTLIYHRKLHDDWKHAAQVLASQLGISVVGRSRGQKHTIGQDFVEERLQIGDEVFCYRQYEQSFTQPNAQMNQRMIAWARAQLDHSDGDLLELYCGNGNFTLPLARNFRRVLATEVSKAAIAAADHNRTANGIGNLEFARLSSAEVAAALAGERPFRRLAHLHQPLSDFNFTAVLVDPPRAGLDAATLALVARFPRVLYISCNPDTLASNLKTLVQTHRIERAALFDQFPGTPHIESGVLLSRR